jgi:hypothetical protein
MQPQIPATAGRLCVFRTPRRQRTPVYPDRHIYKKITLGRNFSAAAWLEMLDIVRIRESLADMFVPF